MVCIRDAYAFADRAELSSELAASTKEPHVRWDPMPR